MTLRLKNLPKEFQDRVDEKLKPKRVNKYRAERVKVDGYSFDSKKEAKRYAELKLLMMTGDVRWFIRQPAYDMGNGTVHRLDFLVCWKDSSITHEDVKGKETGPSKAKRKIIEGRYGIKVELI